MAHSLVGVTGPGGRFTAALVAASPFRAKTLAKPLEELPSYTTDEEGLRATLEARVAGATCLDIRTLHQLEDESVCTASRAAPGEPWSAFKTFTLY